MKIPFISRLSSQKLVYFLAPRNRWGDRLVGLYWFVRTNHRLPTDKPLYNDLLFQMKTTAEILDPLRVFISDKELVKLFVSTVAGPAYPIPTFQVLTTPEEIDAYDFPATCCIKPTHSCGQVILRKDGEELDREEIKSWLAINYYEVGREANYRYLTPKIIVEELVFNSKTARDYKVYCYNGKAKMVQVHIGKRRRETRARYDMNWNLQEYVVDDIPFEGSVERPKNMDEMLAVAEKIAPHFSFIRVDFYTDGDTFHIGELTNCPGGANHDIGPDSAAERLAALIFTD